MVDRAEPESPPAGREERAAVPAPGGSLHWFHLGFDDPALEREFLADYQSRSLGQIRTLLLVLAGLGLFGGIAGALSDRLFTTATEYSAEFQRRLLIVDFGFVFGASVALYFVSWRRWFRTVTDLAVGIYLFLFGPVAIFAIAVAPPQLAWHAFPAAVIHIFNIHLLSRLRFVRAAVCSVAFTGFIFGIAFRVLPFPPTEIARAFVIIGLANVLGIYGSRTLETYARRAFSRARALDQERARADRLLLNIMPEAVAARLKRGERAPADRYDEVTILFADIVGFTARSAERSPEQVVGLLNQLFSALDRLAAQHGVEKIKTIGDAYMVVAGVPEPRVDHAAAICRLALEMQWTVVAMAEELGESIELRIGIHTGSVVAGVIGENKLAYDLWGDAVNVAARMESHGLAGKIQLSAETRRRLPPEFGVTARGPITVKGKGEMETFVLDSLALSRVRAGRDPAEPDGSAIGDPG